jgi:cysteinyl-tRNA synthetase
MVREVNTAADAGQVKQGDIPALLEAICKFDQLIPVVQDDDTAKIQRVIEWAKEEGRTGEISPETLEIARSGQISDEQINALIAERQQARKEKNFARSDEIRDQLAALGIVVEDSKDGIRWKRK